ncbi:MAG: rod shape-determining protein MreC [Victivallales bacterium]|nr:rod shape-determining protein MreC [Victivallales bacterium]
MRYSRVLILLSFLALALAFFFLPRGTRERLRHFGRLFTQPSEEMAAMSLRVGREALGGLPPEMSVAERDELLAAKARLEAESQVRDARVRALEAQNQALQKLLQHVSAQHSYALVVCEVVKRPAWSQTHHTVVVDRGSSSGLRPGQAVLSLEGVVGVVSEATARQAVVELFTSPSFALPCEIAARQVSAVLENHGGQFVLTSVLGAEYDAVQLGDEVVTTDLGSDAMQPGLLLGTIAEKTRDANGAPRYLVDAIVQPATLKYLMAVLPERR